MNARAWICKSTSSHRIFFFSKKKKKLLYSIFLHSYNHTSKMPPNKPYNKKKFVDRREAKSQDIKRALTHRARLRKNYFKLLEKEGLQENRRPEDNQNDSNDEDETRKDRPRPQKKGINFEERAKIVKQRKEEKRRQKLQRVQEKLTTIETKSKERALRKEQFKKTTTKGQPLMGPRINNLLDKIKKDMDN